MMCIKYIGIRDIFKLNLWHVLVYRAILTKSVSLLIDCHLINSLTTRYNFTFELIY